MAVAPAELRWHEEVDIGIVGAGGCGLAAAHAAVQPDLKVVVWERSAAAGGATAMTTGMLAAAGTRLQRAAGIDEVGDDLLNDIRIRNGGRSDAAPTSALCASAPGLVEWLTDDLGIRLELVAQRGDPGHARARLHAPPSRSGKDSVAGLVRQLQRRGIRLRLSTPVLHPWTDANGAVVGVRVKVPRKSPANVRCRKLIIASGGFGANRERLTQYCPAAAPLLYAGPATSTGDAIEWAADIGAALRDMDAFEAYATIALGSNVPIPWAVVDQGAILVNQRGQRFADETQGPSALVAPLCAQPGRVAYEVLDARIRTAVASDDPHFAAEIVPRVLRRAEEVEGLAKQFQIDPAALASTVARYNEVPSGGGTDTFGCGGGAPLAPSFYGVRVGAGLLQTLGGLSIDEHARVLRADGTPIPNVYAGGGAAVGIAGAGSDGYLLGTGLLCALGWGKIAGEYAVRELRAARAASRATPPPAEGDSGP